jgi:hypothetical protein
MTNPSLADRAVSALSDVKSIGENMPHDHPMRFVVRSFRRHAEKTITDAMEQASSLADHAKQLIIDYDKAAKDSTP